MMSDSHENGGVRPCSSIQGDRSPPHHCSDEKEDENNVRDKRLCQRETPSFVHRIIVQNNFPSYAPGQSLPYVRRICLPENFAENNRPYCCPIVFIRALLWAIIIKCSLVALFEHMTFRRDQEFHRIVKAKACLLFFEKKLI